MSVFGSPPYLLESVRKLMVRDGRLDLLGDYIVVGLGGGFDLLPGLLEDARDVSGYAKTIRTYTGFYRGVRVTVIPMGGGPSYAEWAVALAAMKGAKMLVGVGWCGGLQEHIAIGDAVIPTAVLRDEDTTRHYVDPAFPAAADPELVVGAAGLLRPRLEKLGSRLWVGVTVSTSAMLAETRERVEAWRRWRLLCIDGEASTIYILSYLTGIPSLVMLAVSDNVLLGEDMGFDTDLSRKVDMVFETLARTALDLIASRAGRG